MARARHFALGSVLSTTAAVLLVSAGSTFSAYAASASGAGAQQSSFHPNQNAAGSRVDSPCRFSVDGHTWLPSSEARKLDLSSGDNGKLHIGVRAGKGDTCTVSLAAYLTHGPSWQTSGKQEFLDFDTVTVSHGATGQLTITAPGKDCFTQIDLYKGDVKHDGKTADLPEGPDHPVFTGNLIAAWQGGTTVCHVPETPSTPTPSASTSTPPAESTPPATPTPSASQPSAPGTPTPSASVPSSPSTPSTPATTTSTAPAGAVPVTPRPSQSGDSSQPLAETGSSNTVPLAAGAAALVAAGAGALVIARRRRTAQKG
ncbi:LAETG motif-containing sortase-dependent surface protein [Streptomyces andamanensis]|uniref:LAETG motif-containing sortase-dependent surface protein n=1 Tax=Streptomyces andamanensis TaxID=1565035 RepID=A0ABV8TJ96_9ACTN